MAYSLISGSASSSSGTCGRPSVGSTPQTSCGWRTDVAHPRPCGSSPRSSTPSSRWRCWTPRRRSRSAVCAQRLV